MGIIYPTFFIVGPTSTGKSTTAFSLAASLLEQKKFKGIDILSADSKQAYTGEDIVTGKDVPPDFTRYQKDKGSSYYANENQTIRLFGIDCVFPNEEWSVGHFLRYAQQIMDNATKENRLCIVVGGTGLYLESLEHEPASAFIPRDEALRFELEGKLVSELQQLLEKENPERWDSMNTSDRQNPRRLIRAIEVAVHGDSLQRVSTILDHKSESHWIGLECEDDVLKARITTRVQSRITAGAIEETRHLMTTYPDWTKEAKAAIGYEEIYEHIQGKLTLDQLIELWSLHEWQYVKRQRTWFAKRSSIHWVQSCHKDAQAQIASLVQTWYT
jgi:tRNA dimethylallyltransferase